MNDWSIKWRGGLMEKGRWNCIALPSFFPLFLLDSPGNLGCIACVVHFLIFPMRHTFPFDWRETPLREDNKTNFGWGRKSLSKSPLFRVLSGIIKKKCLFSPQTNEPPVTILSPKEGFQMSKETRAYIYVLCEGGKMGGEKGTSGRSN